MMATTVGPESDECDDARLIGHSADAADEDEEYPMPYRRKRRICCCLRFCDPRFHVSP